MFSSFAMRAFLMFGVFVVLVLVMACLRWIFGWQTKSPFSVYDIRTWSLAFALLDAAVFAIIWSAVETALDGAWYASLAGSSVGVLLTQLIAPGLARHIALLAPPA